MSNPRINPNEFVNAEVELANQALDELLDGDYINLMGSVTSRQLDVTASERLANEVRRVLSEQRDAIEALEELAATAPSYAAVQDKLLTISTGLSIASDRILLKRCEQSIALIGEHGADPTQALPQVLDDITSTLPRLAELNRQYGNHAGFAPIIADTQTFAGKVLVEANDLQAELTPQHDAPAPPPRAAAANPVIPPVAGANPVVPPVAAANPVVPPVAAANPVVPPVAGANPVVPPVAAANPVVPPVAAANPVVPPVAAANPVVPPVAGANPVVPPVAGANPVVPPVAAPVPPPAPLNPNAEDEEEGFFDRRKQNKSYSDMRKKFNRFQTLQKLIDTKRSRFNFEDVKLSEIRTWKTMSDELIQNLNKYKNGLIAFRAHNANPAANVDRAYFAAWKNMDHDPVAIDTHIGEVQQMIQHLQAANVRFNELSTNILTNNRLHFSDDRAEVIKDLRDLTPQDKTYYKEILVYNNKLAQADLATHVLSREDYVNALVFEHQNKFAPPDPNNPNLNAAQLQGSTNSPAFRTDKQRDKLHVMGYTVTDNVIDSTTNLSKETKIPVTVVEERKGDAYIHAITAEMQQIQNTSKFADDDIRRLAIKMVDSFRANCKDRLQLNGNWSPKLALAIIAYCAYKGYECKAPANIYKQFSRLTDLRKMEKFCKAQEDAFDATLKNVGAKEVNKLAEDTQITQPYKKGKLPF